MTNEGPGTDHVGPMRGLKIIAWEGDKIDTYIRTGQVGKKISGVRMDTAVSRAGGFWLFKLNSNRPGDQIGL